MGLQNSQTARVKEWHVKFMKVFKKNYKLYQQGNDDVFGSINLYQNINTGMVEVLQKILTFNNDPQIEKIIKTMEKRISKPHPNLLRIYSIEYLQQTQLCGSYQSVIIYTEYLHKTLKTQLSKRRKNGAYLSQELLLKITVSLLNGISYLHQENTFHGEIRAQSILVDGSYHLKLVERALLNPSNWQIVVAQGMGYKLLRGKGVLLSPCILDCLRENATQMANYDPFKADIFAIGIIILECCSLKKAQDFYEYDNLKVKQDQIAKTIYDCRRKYSHKLMNLVDKMLEFEDQNRPQAKQLMQQIQVISGDTIRQMNTTLNQSFLSQTIRSYM